jgi:hypothetical protein
LVGFSGAETLQATTPCSVKNRSSLLEHFTYNLKLDTSAAASSLPKPLFKPENPTSRALLPDNRIIQQPQKKIKGQEKQNRYRRGEGRKE